MLFHFIFSRRLKILTSNLMCLKIKILSRKLSCTKVYCYMNLCVLCMSHLFMTVTIVCSYSDKNPLKHIIEHTEFVTGNYIYLFKQGILSAKSHWFMKVTIMHLHIFNLVAVRSEWYCTSVVR